MRVEITGAKLLFHSNTQEVILTKERKACCLHLLNSVMETMEHMLNLYSDETWLYMALLFLSIIINKPYEKAKPSKYFLLTNACAAKTWHGP